MRFTAAIKRGQRAANRLMVDSCAATRGTGDPVFDPATGTYTPGSSPVYTGRCRLQTSRTQGANPEAGGAVFTVERVELQLPFGVSLEVGDLAEITASVNPVLVGNVYRVTGLSEKTHETKRTYSVEVTS